MIKPNRLFSAAFHNAVPYLLHRPTDSVRSFTTLSKAMYFSSYVCCHNENIIKQRSFMSFSYPRRGLQDKETNTSAVHGTSTSCISGSVVLKGLHSIVSNILSNREVNDIITMRRELINFPLTIHAGKEFREIILSIPSASSLSKLLTSSPSLESNDATWSMTTPTTLTANIHAKEPWDPLQECKSVQAAVDSFSRYTNLPVQLELNNTYATEDVSEHHEETTKTVGDSTITRQKELFYFLPTVSLTPSLTAVIPVEYDDNDKLTSLTHLSSIEKDSKLNYLQMIQSLNILPPTRSIRQILGFTVQFILNLRFYPIYMARTTFQAIRPLLAFCVFGEVMKLALAVMSSGLFIFFFSFVLAFEVLYFFLQCYISYVFLGMFFSAAF